jgi:cell division protein FtsQ
MIGSAMKLPRLRYDRIAWVLFLLIVGIIWARAVMSRKTADVDRLEVTVNPLEGGSKLITEENVRNLLHKSFGSAIEKTQMSALETDRMEKVIEADPFVEKADVYVDQSNKLQVNIVQRNPVLRVMDINGGNYYLDKNGTKMPVSDNFTARVLVATGKLPPYAPDFLEKKGNALKDVFLVAEKIRNDEFFNHFIQQIHVSANTDIMMTPLIGDQVIILGSARKLDDKLERLRIFYKNAMPYEGWRKYSTINLKYGGQVVCKK